MKKIDIIKTKNTENEISAIGKRFFTFRLAISKTVLEMATELNTTETEILAIEIGNKMPSVRHLHELYQKYRLNINWLLAGSGFMYVHDIPTPENKNQHDAQIKELFELMQVPVVEQAISAALLEIQALLELDKSAFTKNGYGPKK